MTFTLQNGILYGNGNPMGTFEPLGDTEKDLVLTYLNAVEPLQRSGFEAMEIFNELKGISNGAISFHD